MLVLDHEHNYGNNRFIFPQVGLWGTDQIWWKHQSLTTSQTLPSTDTSEVLNSESQVNSSGNEMINKAEVLVVSVASSIEYVNILSVDKRAKMVVNILLACDSSKYLLDIM